MVAYNYTNTLTYLPESLQSNIIYHWISFIQHFQYSHINPGEYIVQISPYHCLNYKSKNFVQYLTSRQTKFHYY